MMRIRSIVVLLTAALFAGCSSAGPSGNAHVPEPQIAVQLDRYLGRWYEMARYENRFETKCQAVTAEYRLLDSGHIGIVNTCHLGAVDGPVKVAHGKAKIVANTQNAKLKVSFFGPFYVGDYWILNHASDYSWSIVGEPSGRYLWVLTRQRHPSAGERSALLDAVKALGYDTSMLYQTPQ